MSRAIFRHESNPLRYAVYSTIVDDYILVDCTLEEVKAHFADEYVQRAHNDVDMLVDMIGRKKPPMYPEPDDTPDEAAARFAEEEG